MLVTAFKNALVMSAAGGALALVLLCLRPLTRKFFSPAWQYYIWLAVLLAALLPVRISLPQKAPDIVPIQSAQNVAVDTEAATAENQTFPAAERLPETYSTHKIALPKNIMWYLSLIWLAGAILIFLVKTAKYLMFSRTMLKNSYADNGILRLPKRLCVRRTQMLDAPLIMGLIKPVLYLPDVELTENDMNYILMHELTHYKRHDILYKWFAALVSCVHWFNPLIYTASRQIDEECEISCDAAVASKLTETEQNNYMGMILNMLISSKSKLRPLTTQMASGKKILERRFTMIRNKKKTSKFAAMLSAVIAVVMLGATVFASGVLSGSTEGNGVIGVFCGGERLELKNKPFIADGTVYLPLREMLNLEGIADENITYNDGCAEFYVHSEKPIEYRGELYNFWINRLRIGSVYAYIGGFSGGSTENDTLVRPPLLIDGVTYAPYEAFKKLSASGQGVFDDLSVRVNNAESLVGEGYISSDVNFSVELPLSWSGKYTAAAHENIVNFFHKATYDKFGGGEIFSILRLDGLVSQSELDAEEPLEPVERKVIMQSGGSTYVMLLPGETQGQELENYEEFKAMQRDADAVGKSIKPVVLINSGSPYTIEEAVRYFFGAFSQREFDAMKTYCTQNCVSKFFGDGSVFGMTEASLADMEIDPREYLKSSNGFNVFVTVNMVPAEMSVFDPSQRETSFYVKLLRQPDGGYLIDEFATGI